MAKNITCNGTLHWHKGEIGTPFVLGIAFQGEITSWISGNLEGAKGVMPKSN